MISVNSWLSADRRWHSRTGTPNLASQYTHKTYPRRVTDHLWTVQRFTSPRCRRVLAGGERIRKGERSKREDVKVRRGMSIKERGESFKVLRRCDWFNLILSWIFKEFCEISSLTTKAWREVRGHLGTGICKKFRRLICPSTNRLP